MNLKGPCK